MKTKCEIKNKWDDNLGFWIEWWNENNNQIHNKKINYKKDKKIIN
jgi:hypothetical protein